MAIPQERYVRIASSNAGTSAIQERDLNGLLFTKGRGWIGQGAFGTDAILKCYSVDQVKKYFSSASDEVKFAATYFAYHSRSGTSPASLSFARVKVTDNSTPPKLLSYKYKNGSYGWFTSATAGDVTLEFKDNPADGAALVILMGEDVSDASVIGTYTFAEGVLTAKNQVLVGETPNETAAAFAAVVNGTGGFYGQTANKNVVAVADGAKVKLTSLKAGSDYTPLSTGIQDVVSVVSAESHAGVDEGTTAVGSTVTEAPADALTRVNGLSGNFGSFAILPGDGFSSDEIKALLVQNAGYNYKYLAAVAVLPNDGDFDDTTNEVSFVQAVGAVNGAAGNRGEDGTIAAMPMAIFASVNYGGTNTAPNFMYKQVSGQKATVTSESVADVLDGLHMNYYGLTQVNGQQLAFYQRGFNLDGEDIAVYCNEVWLKSHIATAIFNLQLSVDRIPANDDGESMIYTVVAGAAQHAVTNGTIEPGKTYDDEDIAKIYQLTNDSEAYLTMQNSGYWLDVVIEKDGNERKAKYKLVYGKGDSIRFVEGNDILL